MLTRSVNNIDTEVRICIRYCFLDFTIINLSDKNESKDLHNYTAFFKQRKQLNINKELFLFVSNDIEYQISY